MSILDGLICSRCSIALTFSARPHFQRTLNREDGAKVRMNVTAHQEKGKNEETKMVKKKEKRREKTGDQF